MKDFTKAQAARWVSQEASKHTTPESIQNRIDTEKAQAKLMGDIAAMLPVSAQAHRDLIAVLEQRLV